MNKIDTFFIGMLVGIVVLAICICVVNHFDYSITPMDVYQGKTTLQYKVVDGVKVDSCVVWRENFKQL